MVLKQQEHQQHSSARMFPNNRKLKDKGFVKSSKTLIGNKTRLVTHSV
jgi:hypothetical protein